MAPIVVAPHKVRNQPRPGSQIANALLIAFRAESEVHSPISAAFNLPDDQPTTALWEFLDRALKQKRSQP